MKHATSLAAALVLSAALSSAKDIDLKKFGARNDGRTKITAVLQKAIDKVSASGGGRVILAEGVFLTGPVELKSGVELHVDAAAVLLASPDLEDYPDRTDTRHFDTAGLPRWRNIALIYADEASGIAITGRGTIDCNGKIFVRKKEDPAWKRWMYESGSPIFVKVGGSEETRFEAVRNISFANIICHALEEPFFNVRSGSGKDISFTGCQFFKDDAKHYPEDASRHGYVEKPGRRDREESAGR